MRHNRIFFLFSLVLTVVIVFGFSPNGSANKDNIVEELSLSDCIEFALKNHPDIKEASFNLWVAQQALKKLELEDPLKVSLKELDLAKEEIRRLKEVYEETCRNLVLSIESKYYQVLKALQRVENKKFSLEWSKKNFQIIEIKYQNGLISTKEYTAMLERLEKDEKAYDRALFDLETERMDLNITMSRDLMDFFELKDKEFPFQPVEISFDEAMELALENNENIYRARKTLDDAKKNLQFKMDLKEPRLEILKAQHEVEKAQVELKRAKEKAIIEIRSAYMNFISTQEMVTEVREDYQETLDDLKVLEIKYEAGMISLNELLEGERQVAEAQVRCIEVIYDFNLSKASFIRTIGKEYFPIQIFKDTGSDSL